jgi:alpha-amylase
MAILMSTGADGNKWMNTLRPDATFYDLTEHLQEKVVTDEDEWGNFLCKGGKVYVWLQE